MESCTSCKYYNNSFFGLLSHKCYHPQSIDKGFSFTDPVTGHTRKYEDRQMKCYKARFPSSPCGPNARLWEHK